MSTLVPFWFILIAVLWTGFFILEGFDFGVGMLHSAVGNNDAERRAAINTIGPLWDGNEVWLIVAGAAMFAAFPGWYATMFSAFNLALVLLLAALIARGLSFEYRGKRDSPRWRRTWDALLTVSSVLAPLLIGLAFGDLLQGLPINSAQNYTGSFWDLFQPYGLFTGVTLTLICALHGATFLSLKTTGDMRERSRDLARRIAPVTAAAVIGFAIWTHVAHSDTFFLNPVELLAILAVLAAFWLVYEHRDGFAFAATTVTMASAIVAIFTGLYPNVMVSVHQRGQQPDRTQHRVPGVPAQGNERRRDHLAAGGAHLPGLDLLRIPAARQRPGVRAAGDVTRARPVRHAIPSGWEDGQLGAMMPAAGFVGRADA